ncbi:MAG: AAA family ATPase [Cyclobacteriaceae bacterium]|nr:AAA family ATPase [Cyclobacteriaceae bacterium]
MFERTIENTIKEKINGGKAIVVVGARQVGKTTLLKEILKGKDYLFLDADDPATRNLLQSPTTEQIRTIIGDYKYVFLDEAQRISGISLTLKIITDQFKKVQLLVSGSSSFDLGNELNEPLTGRKWEYELFPISWEEYENKIDFVEENNGQITGFEFKWNNRKTRFPQNFMESYKAEGQVIDRNNFREFVKI